LAVSCAPCTPWYVGHVPGRGDVRLGLDVGQADRQPRLRQQPGHPHRRTVGEHHHQHAVQAGALELAHHPLGVLAVLDRLGRDELADAGQLVGDLGRVAGLTLGDAGDHVVVQILHDAQDPDAGPTRGHDIPP